MQRKPSPAKTRTAKERALNIRLLLTIAVATILLGIGISQLHRVQTRRNSGALIEQSERAVSNGDLIKAEEYLRLFLGYHPHHRRGPGKVWSDPRRPGSNER